MRNLSFAVLVAAAAVLSGCNFANQGSQETAAQKAANAPIPSAIQGTVNLRDPVQVAAGSKLDAKLVDVAQPDIVIAEKTSEVSGAPPFQFTLDLDPGKIDRSRTYVVNVTLTDGERRFVPALAAPVLTGGAGATTKILLNPEPTPAEELKEEFSHLQSQIGGMKKVDGTYTTDDASIGWDAFGEKGQVRFARVNTDFDKGGRTSVKYAYKDGKPMYVKQQGGATIGWNENGDVLVNEKPGGESASDDEIKAAHDAAEKAYDLAQNKLDASRKH